jgi:signal transduction histidine kinase
MMRTPSTNPREISAFRNFGRFWAITTYLMLGFGMAFALFDRDITPQNRWISLGLAVVWGAWYGVFIAQSERFRWPVLLQGILFAVVIALSMVMAWLEPSFLLMAFSFYGITFGIMPLRWAIPLVIWQSLGLALLIMDFSGGISVQNLPILGGFFLSGFFAIMLGLFISSIIRQSQERQKMIDELQATRAELAQAERQAGQMEERQRLAGEIHDTLAQGFTSIVMHLEAAEQALERDPAAAKQRIVQSRQIARDHLSEARRFLWALRPDVVTREPLSQAIERVARRWSEETGLAAEVSISGEPVALPAPLEATLLRTAQEALTNIRKHAQAHRATLTLSYMDDEVILDVQDDGIGFTPGPTEQADFEHGYGLVSLRESARQLGGTLEIESTLGEGMTLAMALPYPLPNVKGDNSEN